MPPPSLHTEAPAENEIRRAIPALGAVLKISLWTADPSQAEIALSQIEEVLIKVGATASASVADSEVNKLNSLAGGTEFIESSDLLWQLLETSDAQAKLTDGLFDVTIGPLTELWGFTPAMHGQEKAPPGVEEIENKRALIGYEAVALDAKTKRVRLALKGMKLDFENVARGLALDECVKILKAEGIVTARLSLGDQYFFLGKPKGSEAWNFGVRDPRDPSRSVVEIQGQEGSAATAGDYFRYFMYEKKRYANILNPLTGWPSKGVASVTVWAESAAMANIWSTALYIAGPEKGKRLLARAKQKMSVIWIMDPGEEVTQPKHFKVLESGIAKFNLFAQATN